MRKKIAVQDGIESYAADIIQKISDPLTKKTEKHTKELNKKIAN